MAWVAGRWVGSPVGVLPPPGRTRKREEDGSRRAAPSDRSKRTNPQWPRAARGVAPRARAHPTPRAHRGSRAPPPVELPRPGSEAAGTHLRNNRHFRCLRGAPCVRCVHARRGVRSGEARRLGVLRACASLSIYVRPGAGEANEAQGPTTYITTRVRACGLTCVKSPRLARCTPPRSCSSALRDRADRAAAHLDGAGRREGRSAVTSTAWIHLNRRCYWHGVGGFCFNSSSSSSSQP